MLNERIAKNVGPDGIDIAWDERGERSNPTVLLVSGESRRSFIHWPEGFLDALVCRGLHVLRFDNRDAGTRRICGRAPSRYGGGAAGDLASASYTLAHMAADAVGLLDAVGIESAHVVGASMGDIAQTMAIEHLERVRSLTSLMSTTGAPTVGQADPETLKALFGGRLRAHAAG